MPRRSGSIPLTRSCTSNRLPPPAPGMISGQSIEKTLHRFDRHVQSKLVPILEAIGHGLRGSEYADADAIHLVCLDPCSEGLSGEPKHPNRRMLQARRLCTPVECQVDLMRDLSRALMENQGRDKRSTRRCWPSSTAVSWSMVSRACAAPSAAASCSSPCTASRTAPPLCVLPSGQDLRT